MGSGSGMGDLDVIGKRRVERASLACGNAEREIALQRSHTEMSIICLITKTHISQGH